MSNLMLPTGLKKVGMGAEKARHFKKIQLGEHLATNLFNCNQDCNMISYKMDVFQAESLRNKARQRLSNLCNSV